MSRQQVALMLGNHQRLSRPQDNKVYIAGIDLAGESQLEVSLPGAPATKQSQGIATPSARNQGTKGQDSTVITVAELGTTPASPNRGQPGVELPCLTVVEQYQWTGIAHSQLYSQMVAILRKWDCQRIVVDATGIGQPVASFLRKELGSRVKPFTLTQKSKSSLGFDLLSFINSGRLKLYQQDGSPEYQQMMFQLERARAQYRPNQLMNFYLDPEEGHDDFLTSLALLVTAASEFRPRQARGSLRTG